MRILSFGEIIWDCYETESCIGGAALNFAAHCAKCGAESYLFSAVGGDALGAQAVDVLEGFGVDCTYIQTSPKGTGRCLVTLNAAGIPQYNVLTDTAYDNIACTPADLAAIVLDGFDALYFGTLIQRSPVSRESLRRLCAACTFPETICDVNLRSGCYDEDSVRFCLSKATVLKISDEEEPTLRAMGMYSSSDDPSEIAASLCAAYPQVKYLLLTQGSKGCYIYGAREKRGFPEPAKPVTVASTVGAGDSFAAAWMVSYLSGKSPEAAAKTAAALSGFVVSRTDAVPAYERGDFFHD